MLHCRQFLNLIASLRMKCLELTPSEMLRYMVVETGYLEYYMIHLSLLMLDRLHKRKKRDLE